jgi:hypothetical protein
MNSKDLTVQTSQLERRSIYQVGQLMPAQDEWVRLLFTQMPIDESTTEPANKLCHRSILMHPKWHRTVGDLAELIMLTIL